MQTQRKIISVRRHAQPAKDPETGASLDYLMPEGLKQAVEIGIAIKEKYGQEGIELSIFGRCSPKYRALQTVQGILYGAGADSGMLVWKDYGKRAPLDTMIMSPELKKHALLDEQGSKRPYDYVVQYLIDNIDEKSEQIDYVGGRIAGEIKSMLGYLKKNISIKDVMPDPTNHIEGVSHGPVVEIALMKILGADKVADIGGGFKPGENFEFYLEMKPKSGNIVGVELHYREKKAILTPNEFEAKLEKMAKYKEV